MLEQQRVEYLQSMGIQLWMPRKPVSHAAESLWYAGQESSASSSESSNEQVKVGHAADLLANMGLVSTAEQSARVNDANPLSHTVKTIETQNIVAESVAIEVPSTEQDKSHLSSKNVTSEIDNHDSREQALVDSHEGANLTIPEFELHFSLWPCGILWVASQPFCQQDHSFQTSVSYYLLKNSVPQASYSHFKWPYIQGSSEDQSIAVALRALTAQWDFMSGQGARAWVAVDSSSLEWLSKVASKPIYSVDDKEELYTFVGKKQLWHALQNLSKMTVS